jgi:hypothetical protein
MSSTNDANETVHQLTDVEIEEAFNAWSNDKGPYHLVQKEFKHPMFVIFVYFTAAAHSF